MVLNIEWVVKVSAFSMAVLLTESSLFRKGKEKSTKLVNILLVKNQKD